MNKFNSSKEISLKPIIAIFVCFNIFIFSLSKIINCSKSNLILISFNNFSLSKNEELLFINSKKLK